MTYVSEICNFLEQYAPTRLAEDWDNVGLLLGDGERHAARIMTCLTVTPETMAEAVEQKADLIVTHHPMPFRPLKRITNDTTVGRIVMALLENRVAVYSPHTSFDSAENGINQQLAKGLGVTAPVPLLPLEGDPEELGSGRVGKLDSKASLTTLIDRTKTFMQVNAVQFVGAEDTPIEKVAVACGSAGQFLQPAMQAGCDCLVTGETNFHTCLEAKANGIALILPGHYASERFALDVLASQLQQAFPDANIWASTEESDPINWA